jgi:hypothetical protein
MRPARRPSGQLDDVSFAEDDLYEAAGLDVT